MGERIDHVDGVTVEEAEHQIATRLYQNTARIHFNQYTEGKGRFGRRVKKAAEPAPALPATDAAPKRGRKKAAAAADPLAATPENPAPGSARS